MFIKKELFNALELKDEEEKERIGIFLYEKAATEIKAANELIKEVNDQLDSYVSEMEEIL